MNDSQQNRTNRNYITVDRIKVFHRRGVYTVTASEEISERTTNYWYGFDSA